MESSKAIVNYVGMRPCALDNGESNSTIANLIFYTRKTYLRLGIFAHQMIRLFLRNQIVFHPGPGPHGKGKSISPYIIHIADYV